MSEQTELPDGAQPKTRRAMRDALDAPRVPDRMSAGEGRRPRDDIRDDVNMFIDEDHETLPRVPDTPEWHYQWVRCRVQGNVDGRNIAARLNGRLPFYIVDPAEVPSLNVNKSVLPTDERPCIQVNDVILMKCEQRLYQMYREAEQIRADRLRQQPAETARSAMSDRRARFRPQDHVDEETYGYDGDG